MTNLSTPEPAPVPNDEPSIHDLVKLDIEDRKQFGLIKYGTVLQAGNKREAIVDAYQELLDMACYLRVWIEQDRQRDEEIESLQADVAEMRRLLEFAASDRLTGYTETIHDTPPPPESPGYHHQSGTYMGCPLCIGEHCNCDDRR